MFVSALNSPKFPLYLKLLKAELKRSVVNVEIMQQKNVCQESFKFQNEETSSMEKRSPPTGAPNAEDTPAATPADTKFLLQMCSVLRLGVVLDCTSKFKV